MQITTNTNSLQVYQQQSERVAAHTEKNTDATQKAPAPKNDSIALSHDAKLLAEAHAVAGASPDVRTDKVAQLREQVQNGTYAMDNERIAQALLKEEKAIFGA